MDNNNELFSGLPVEMRELVMMKVAVKLFVMHKKTLEAGELVFQTLAGVSYSWWQTVIGWPESGTRYWFKHKFKHVCRPYARRPQLLSTLELEDSVCCVAQLDDRIYVVCGESDIMRVFDSHYKRLKDIHVQGLKHPSDIVVCRESRVLYVADSFPDADSCVWRVTEKHEVKKFISNANSAHSLSVTSRRLLVTSGDDKLRLFRPDGAQLNQVSLRDDMRPLHAVETDNNTFVVSHWVRQFGVSEIDVDGRVIRVCSQHISWPHHLALDVDGRVFVTDLDYCRVLLLNKQLQLERALIYVEDDEEYVVSGPRRLCYVPQTGRLLVGSQWCDRVKVYSLVD